MPTQNARDRLAAQSSGGLDTAVIPPIPYVAPPTNPKQLPQWFARWHEEMERWREQTNGVIQRAMGGSNTFPTVP